MYHKVAADASTLILLEKAKILAFVLKKNKILIPTVVYQEAVTKGIEKGLEDASPLKENLAQILKRRGPSHLGNDIYIEASLEVKDTGTAQNMVMRLEPIPHTGSNQC